MRNLLAILILLTGLIPVQAQRTPFYVNGSVVNNPNLTTSDGVTVGLSGSDITLFPIGLTNSGGTTIVTNLTVLNNTYISNAYITNLTVDYLYVTTNLNVLDMTVTNNITVKGNASFGGDIVITNNLYVNGTFYGTIDATTTNATLKQKKSLKLQYPRFIDGVGCTYSNTNDYTAVHFMVPLFGASGATNANYAQWAVRVPSDIDTTQDLTASLTVELAGADTDAATYTVGTVSIANFSAAAGTPANYVTLTIPADASGASGDIESVNNVTLTGWAAALTANQWMLIRLQRDGTDASAVAQYGLELEITYVSSQ